MRGMLVWLSVVGEGKKKRKENKSAVDRGFEVCARTAMGLSCDEVAALGPKRDGAGSGGRT